MAKVKLSPKAESTEYGGRWRNNRTADKRAADLTAAERAMLIRTTGDETGATAPSDRAWNGQSPDPPRRTSGRGRPSTSSTDQDAVG